MVSLSPNELIFMSMKQYRAWTESNPFLGLWRDLLQVDVARSGPAGISFSVTNRSVAESFKILWDDSAIILPDNTPTPVIHFGVKDVDTSQLPTVIPPGARIDEYAGPTANIEFLGGEWDARPLFSSLADTGTLNENENGDTLIEDGDTVSFFLVIEVGPGERRNVKLTFAAHGNYKTLEMDDEADNGNIDVW